MSPVAIEAAARAAHEAVRAYCIALGDFSQPAWDDAAAGDQRASARSAVQAMIDGSHPRPSRHEAGAMIFVTVAGALLDALGPR